jgi:3-hydroxyacyl-CoA dehydrogenase/enoyl-CoA hydratase/3-hydroxybutyryl-CoA epimerase
MSLTGETFNHWHQERDGDQILWLTLDRGDSSANSLSREVIDELDRLLTRAEQEPPKGLVIRSGKSNGFVAGADVHEFTTISDEAAALALINRGQSIMNRLEALPMPTVALINGFCLGGGLELALACRYRIAASDSDGKLGLPEIQLGIHPGFGGTVRLPRLIGDLAAMNLMLTGRGVTARSAKKLGLVDFSVPLRQLENGARAMILSPPPPRQAPLMSHLMRLPGVTPLIAWYLRRTVAKRVRPDQYPAPFALINLWQHFAPQLSQRYSQEATSVARLIIGATARNLTRVFLLQGRLKDEGKGERHAIHRVHVVGGGTMGGDIAAWCALQGMVVTIQDRDLGRLAAAVRRGAALFGERLKERRLLQGAMDRLIPDATGESVSSADLVIEAIFEDVAAKQALFRELEPRLAPHAILASNTSSIPLAELASVLTRPERLVGLHFFNPVSRMQLVEVVRWSGANPQTLAMAQGFVHAIKRLPLPVASSPGFLVNRILLPYLLEGVTLVEEGVAPALVDRAATAFGMPMGPILLADTVGLDICLSVARILAQHYPVQVPPILEKMVSAGQLGKKSGQGFYRYRNGRPEVATPDSRNIDPQLLQDRLMLRYLNEAVATLREGIVSDADLLDAGMIFGTGFSPFRGGPIHYTESTGVTPLLERLRQLEGMYGPRFTPDAGWQNLTKGR